ncbi:uncharacterized protein EHS24_008805 [Apiotrichum porosum]|uniref:ADP-ribosylglycohydrolase n=1 Tax=Apiotrichum porosum TaxID=105984 RepID=A0A427XN89_9TREE|nr:uncharacterized protein EHS24_008805 [Apiotrichum porosum]RSH80232.1 hypothetical protein EHS24_008805 [Apiotrichum porosum]
MPSSVATTPAVTLPPDYLERTYAGVLGKLIGVYLGRPFEGWTHQRIMAELGPIKYYVHEQLNVPCVVTDDDVSGTFAFVRALEEHDAHSLGSLEIGKTWLNQVVEHKSVFWWGGRGLSTEHTAFLNLKQGIPAPDSGSIKTNGQTVAEQIGAQIFIDGWAMACPGRPELAASLAEAAGRVSHDGESVHAAVLWAAMEAEAYVSSDVDHLINTGLKFIPRDSLIASIVADVRAWVKDDRDWVATRQRIEDTYGYDKFPGHCHVVPNHCIMVMSLLYAENDFTRSMEIVNTSGWDTDCNSGNVGCLMAIMLGMDAFDRPGAPDWRGPIGDRAIISSADNGYSINSAARIATDIVNMGRCLARKAPLPPAKDGAQFHFTLPGSTQGFRVRSSKGSAYQAVDTKRGPALCLELDGPIEVTTPISAPKEYLSMPTTYFLSSSPLVYPGQRLRVALRAGADLSQPVEARIRLQVFYADNNIVPVDSEDFVLLTPGDDELHVLEWTIPQIAHGYPIAEAGVVTTGSSGTVWLDSFGWSGQPDLTISRPNSAPHAASTFWDLQWVQNVSGFFAFPPTTLLIAQDIGEGLVSYGTRDWTDYRVTVSDFVMKLGSPAGVTIRVRGLRRWYALLFSESTEGKYVSLVKALDEQRIELATAEFQWTLDSPYEISLAANGPTITGSVGGVTLTATDEQYVGGAMGFVVTSGSLATGTIRIQSCK